MQMPKGTATRVARKKPANTRPVLATMSWNRIPSRAIEASDSSTAAGDGKNLPSTSSRALITVHSNSGINREDTCKPLRSNGDGVAPIDSNGRGLTPPPSVADATIRTPRWS